MNKKTFAVASVAVLSFIGGCLFRADNRDAIELKMLDFVVQSVTPSYPAGAVDGDITITAPNVNITDIYENDLVTGVTTFRGINRGLNKGSTTYDPQSGVYIHANNFTIANGASLTAYARTTTNKQGVIWITCSGTFTNNGTVDLVGKGYSGGAGGAGGTNGSTASGSGPGNGGAYDSRSYPTASAGAGGGGGGHANSGSTGNNGQGASGGAGGASYGTASIPTTTWANLYGSGGGGGGGGSAGTVYIVGANGIVLGSNLITASAGNGGPSGGYISGAGSAGSVGRIHIEGAYSGTTLPAPQ